MNKGLHKKALRLEYFTLGYNILEGAASIVAGSMAGSVALLGFGLDSAVESVSGAVLIWRLRAGATEEEEGRREKTALRLVAASFFLLGTYVLFEALEKLYLRQRPLPTLPGLIIAALSVIIMPSLARRKSALAAKAKIRSLEADSKQTMICALLSLALLAGLALNYLFGLWWADPASALIIAVFIFREGLEMIHGEGQCSSCK